MIFNNLDVEAYDRQYGDRDLLRRVWEYATPHRGRVAVIAASVAAVSALLASVPLMLSAGVGRLEALRDAPPGAGPGLPWGLIAALFAAWVLVWLGNYLRRRYTSRLIGDVVLALRRDAFDAAVRHDLSFYDRIARGRVISRITTDTNDFGQSITLVADLVAQVVEVTILTVFLVRISGRLTLLALAMGPLVLLSAWGFRIMARKVTRQGARASAEVNAKIQETVAGISVAKNYRRESTIYGEFDAVNRSAYRINLIRGLTLSTVFPVLNVLIGVGTGLILYCGAGTVVAGAISVAAWFLFMQGIDRFWFPLMNLTAFWSQVQVGFSAIERIFALIDAEPTVHQRAADPVPRLRGHVVLEHLRFGYEADSPILPDFSLEVPAGSSVALVGHTGAGKSSIARLLTRFYEFQDGRLLVDGRDVRTLDLTAYRRQLGIVPQSPFLFGGSVADNIRYARPEATDEEIEAVARRIGEGEWLDALPDGLATDVGERGRNLSMGQRQLVALMRVLVQHPAIFILDEATASIDPFTEAQIQEALELILSESTSFVIAHRLSTVRAADRILVIDRGRIIESGDHEALMAAGGHYAELYDTYFRHQAPDYVLPESIAAD